MTARRNTRQAAALRKSAEMMYFAPQVIAIRTARMLAHDNGSPSRRHDAEMGRMVAEKWQAGAESMWGIGGALMRANMQLGTQLAQQWWSLWFRLWWGMGSTLAPRGAQAAITRTAWHMLDEGIGPFQRRVRANARRLTAR